MAKSSLLNNFEVVSFESRLAKTLEDLLSLQGATVLRAPALEEAPLEDNRAALDFGEALFAGRVDGLVLLTGVGAKTLIDILATRRPQDAVVDRLKKIPVLPRGPKPVRVMRELGIPVALTVPEPNTWHELLNAIDANPAAFPLDGKTIAVQEYGVSNQELIQGLEHRGARVMAVPVYRWKLPKDLAPLEKAIQRILAGQIQVALFTTSVQAEHLFQVATDRGERRALREAFEKVVVASVGPDCSRTLRSLGLTVDIEPESPKMGPLVEAVAARARALWEKKNRGDCAVEVKDALLNIMAEAESAGAHGNLPTPAQDSVFMKACRREKTPYTPIWLMRQAGRYMKEYRAIREKNSFLSICKNKDLVTEITVTAQERLGVDAAIIFADILLIVEPLGLPLDFLKGDGPTIKRPVRTAADIDALREADPAEGLSFVFEAIRQTRRQLKPSVPLIGFAGAPFTVASYIIEGGSSEDFEATKKLMYADDEAWKALMQKIARVTAAYLNGQIRAGVQAVQLFDSWAGCLEPGEYEEYVMPYTRAVFQALPKNVPAIHFGTGTGPFLEKFAEAGGSVIGVDHRVKLDEAWRRIGYARAIQGNLDPLVLCSSLDNVKRHARMILDQAAGRPGHIFNLGHGILPETPVDHAAALVEAVHEMSCR